MLPPPECFADNRSDELDFLVRNYDERAGKSGWSRTSSGVAFTDGDRLSAEGVVLFPVYNVQGVTTDLYKDFFSVMYRIDLMSGIALNFNWIPYNLREYRKAHLPLWDAFLNRCGVSLDAVLAVVAALSLRMVASWHATRGLAFFRYSQRAYEVCSVDFIRNEILDALPLACRTLGITESSVSSSQIQAAIQFWSLDDSKRREIDLSYSGPHCILIPIDDSQALVDYAWIVRRLHDLFFGVSVRDENFKGDALEDLVRKKASALPTGPCKALSGEQQQIDHAVSVGDCLIVAECKAVAMSIGFNRGNPEAVRFRNENVVERALSEADQKARWLSQNRKGTNYDTTRYTHIVPVAISPFVEFIPSRATYYWLSENVPRVLTPAEFEDFVDDTVNVTRAFNTLTLRP